MPAIGAQKSSKQVSGDDVVVETAWLYYEDGLNQTQIAAALETDLEQLAEAVGASVEREGQRWGSEDVVDAAPVTTHPPNFATAMARLAKRPRNGVRASILGSSRRAASSMAA